jgi:predicted nucleic acid-binding protein
MAESTADFVLDANALAKLFLDESESKAFRAWRNGQVEAGARFAAPELLGYEIAHIVAKAFGPTIGRDRFATLVRKPMEGIALHAAWHAVGDYLEDATAYDASYLATAAASGATLVTYDRELQRAAKQHAIAWEAPA